MANITIAADASVEVYDVLVTTSKGKRGIGIELFAVQESQARSASKEYDQTVIGKLPGAGSCRSTEINDLGDVAGYCSFGSGVYRGFFWRDGVGMIDLGEVLTRDYMDLSDEGPTGPIIIGHTQLYSPTIWHPIASGAPSALPAPAAFPGEPGAGCAPRARGITGSGDLIVGQVCVEVNGQISTMPVIWRRTGTYWSGPEFLPLASGRESGSAYQVSKHGVIAGILLPNTNPWDWFVWFPPYTSAPEPMPFGAFSNIWIDGINDAGDAVGSGEGHHAVFWKRNGIGWDVQEISDTGSAYGINESSDVVGTWDGGLRVWSLGFTTYVDHGYGYEINSTGSITGRDEDGNLRGKAVKWTPKP
jgi:probable HAF family extracellular repeat protein